eukprot:1187985-Prorocentrum_minimum.AAC.3
MRVQHRAAFTITNTGSYFFNHLEKWQFDDVDCGFSIDEPEFKISNLQALQDLVIFTETTRILAGSSSRAKPYTDCRAKQ